MLDSDGRAHLVEVASGDARNALLNALELAVESTAPGAEGMIHITLDVAQGDLHSASPAALDDKDGDADDDTISAFIKSVRGFDRTPPSIGLQR